MNSNLREKYISSVGRWVGRSIDSGDGSRSDEGEKKKERERGISRDSI